jgi:hypothetical protein
MHEKEKLEQVITVLSRQLQANAQEREVTLALLDEFEELLEVVSSEIPIQSPKRQRVEEGLSRLRAMIAAFREQLRGSQPNNPAEKA